MISTKVIVIQIFLLTSAAAYKYEISFRDETFFSPCNISNVKEGYEYIDFSNTTTEFLNNGSLYVHGTYELIKDIGLEDNPFRIQSFKKIRGSWTDTVYGIYRNDLCKTLFDPYDVAYKYVKDIIPEERKCPFYKGKIFTVDEASDVTFEIADPRFDGEYKIEIMISLTGIKETLCTNIFAEIYKA